MDDTFAKNIATPQNDKIIDEVLKIAKEINRTQPKLALCWLRQRPGVVIRSFGAKKVDQLKDNMACVDLELHGSVNKPP